MREKQTQSPPGRVIHQASMALEMPVAELDMTALRRLFAELFDQVNAGVFSEGLDCDDVILERYVDVREGDGATSPVLVQWLSDRERFLGDLALEVKRRAGARLPAQSSRADALDAELAGLNELLAAFTIVGARVRAMAGP